jgi:hypothetical protein
MNTVLFLALASLPGADPAPANGGTCACKATSTSSVTSVTPVPPRSEKPPLFHRLSGLFGKRHLFHKDETPANNPQPQYNVNAYDNFRPECVIMQDPITRTGPVNQGPMLMPSSPAPLPSTQAPLLMPAGPAPLPRTPTPTTAEPPLN